MDGKRLQLVWKMNRGDKLLCLMACSEDKKNQILQARRSEASTSLDTSAASHISSAVSVAS